MMIGNSIQTGRPFRAGAFRKNLGRRIYMLLFFSFSLCGLSSRTLAEEIKVPRLAADEKGKMVTGVGFCAVQDKYIFAFELKNAEALKNDNSASIVFMVDTDNDKNTGRNGGWDFQGNIVPALGTFKPMLWKTLPDGERNKLNGIPDRIRLHPQDFRLDFVGNTFYAVFNAKQCPETLKFGPLMKITVRIRVNDRMTMFNADLNTAESSGFIRPPLQFVSFTEGRDIRTYAPDPSMIKSESGVIVWNSYGERYEENAPIPEMKGDAGPLMISGAKGERETAYFAISRKTPVRSLEIQVGEMKNAGGANIPAKNCRLLYGGFVYDSMDVSSNDLMGYRFIPSNSKNTFAAVDVEIPRNASPGTYRGNVTCTIDGKDKIVFPLEVEVFNFALPENPFFQLVYCLRSIRKTPCSVDKQKELDEQRKNFAACRFSYRLTGIRLEVGLDKNDNPSILNLKEYKAALSEYFGKYRGQTYQEPLFQLGSHALFAFGQRIGAPEIDSVHHPRFAKIYRSLLTQVFDFLRQNGWEDRITLIIWDEPYSNVYDQLQVASALIRKNFPDRKIACWINDFKPEIADSLDQWITNPFWIHYYNAHPELLKKYDLKMYERMNLENVRIPAGDYRSYFWMADRYHISAYWIYMINHLETLQYEKNGRIVCGDPGHCWFYPDPEKGPTRFSLRMLHFRDGVDDYDYLQLYRNLTGKDPVSVFPEAFPTLQSSGNVDFHVASNRELLKIRRALAGEIEKRFYSQRQGR